MTHTGAPAAPALLYKLTTMEGRSKHGDRVWTEGCCAAIPERERGTILCQAGLLHAYRGPEIGLLRDPGDGNYGPALRLWECRGEVIADDGLKVGCHELRDLRELPVPAWYRDPETRLRAQVRFALLCWQSLGQPDPWEVRSACERVLTALRGSDAARVRAAAARAAGAAASAAWAAASAAGAAARAAEAAARAELDFRELARAAVEMEATKEAEQCKG